MSRPGTLPERPTASTRPQALIIDQRHTHAVEVCRALARQGYAVDAFAEAGAPVLRSRRCRRRIASPPWDSGQPFLDRLQETVDAMAYDVIYICNEEILEVIAPIAGTSDRWRGLVLPEADRLRLTFSKNAVLDLIREAGVPVPRTAVPADATAAAALARAWGLPVVVKGEKGGGSYNVRICRTPDEVLAAYREIAGREAEYGGRPALQEHIPGETYLFGGLFQDGQALRICGHRKVLMYPPGQGATAKAVTDRHPDLVRSGLRAMRALRYSGLGSLDFIRDARDGQFKFLEINPRLWASVGVAEHAGVDLYGAYRRVAQGVAVEPDLRYREGVQFHLIAKELQLILKRPRRLLGFLRDCADPRVGSDFDWTDLRPLLTVLAGGLRPGRGPNL